MTAIVVLLGCTALSWQPTLADLRPASRITALAFSPDGLKVAVGTAAGRLYIRDAITNNLRLNLVGHLNAVFAVAWSPSGQRLASGDQTSRVYIWDTASGRALVRQRQRGSVDSPTWPAFSVVWSPSGTQLATGSFSGAYTLQYWNPLTGQALATFDVGAVADMAWSFDGSKLALANGIVRIVDAQTAQELFKLKLTQDRLPGQEFVPEYALAWSPDNHLLASGSVLGSVQIWDVASQQVLANLPASDTTDILDAPLGSLSILSVTFSADGQTLSSASADGTIRIWSVATHQVLGAFHLSQPITAAAWNIDGHRLVYGQADGVVASTWILPSPSNLKDLVASCVSDKGLYNSLDTHITAGQWQTLITILEAQSGEKIEPHCAAQLIQMASFLLNPPVPPPTTTATPKPSSSITLTTPSATSVPLLPGLTPTVTPLQLIPTP